MVQKTVREGYNCDDLSIGTLASWAEMVRNTVGSTSELEVVNVGDLDGAFFMELIERVVGIVLDMEVKDFRQGDRAINGGDDTFNAVLEGYW
jgi:hypothetical protein